MCYIYFKDNLISKLIIKPKNCLLVIPLPSMRSQWRRQCIHIMNKGGRFLKKLEGSKFPFSKVALRWMATLENNMVTKKNFLKMAIVHLIIWPNINRFFKFLPFQICWLLIGDLCQNFSCQTYFLPAMVTKMVTTWSAELWYCISDRYYKIIWFNQQSF